MLFLFLYLCYLKKYMNDYMYYILSIYIPTIAIVAFLIFFICKVRRILSLFFILFNILIIYISIRNIYKSFSMGSRFSIDIFFIRLLMDCISLYRIHTRERHYSFNGYWGRGAYKYDLFPFNGTKNLCLYNVRT